MTKTILTYLFPGGSLETKDLEHISRISGSIAKGTMEVRKGHPGIDYKVYIPKDRAMYQVEFKGSDPGKLKDAVKSFLDSSYSAPDYVKKSAGLVRPLLKEKGYSLERRLFSLGLGNRVNKTGEGR